MMGVGWGERKGRWKKKDRGRRPAVGATDLEHFEMKDLYTHKKVTCEKKSK